MFIRKVKNRSGSVSIQIISKEGSLHCIGWRKPRTLANILPYYNWIKLLRKSLRLSFVEREKSTEYFTWLNELRFRRIF